jgi:hypothetical protein
VREDDPERAVRCGLALLAEGRAIGAEVQAAHGHAGFGVRVGIHTGGVLLGGGVDGEGSIRGIAVNIAARMEQTAPAGALRISHDTHALVRGCSRSSRRSRCGQGRGRTDAQLAGAARRARRGAGGRGIEGVATRMVGRDGELAAIQALFAQVAGTRRLAAITVVAEAGIGKSRLLQEAARWMALETAARTCCTGAPGRRPRASPTACCASSSPAGSGSATTTASPSRAPRSSKASRRCSPPTTAPTWRRRTPTSSAT